MKKIIKRILIEDFKKIGILFLIAFIILKIVFYKESLFVLFKLTFSLFYLYFIPLYLISYLFFKRESFIERIIITVPFNIAILNIFSYYLAIIGLNFNYHHLIIPPFLLLISFILFYKFNDFKNNKS